MTNPAFRPRRCLLFVPADRPDRIEKAARNHVDGVILDLEDGVSVEHKSDARLLAADALSRVDFGHREAIVRINAVGSAFWEADLAALAGATRPPDAISVPKVDSPGVLSAVEREMRRRGLVSALMPWLENAAGILAAPAIALSSPTVSALLFGAYDFAADVGADVAWDPLRFARSQVVLAAAAAGIVALDGPLADFRDDRRLRRDCILGRRMGFTGKVAIHPAQVDIVTPHFTPSAEEIARSRRVVETITDAERGAVRLDQTMIDRATYRIALRHLALSERLAESGES